MTLPGAKASSTVAEFRCGACGSVIPLNKRYCIVCGTDNVCPNVRLAQSVNEKKHWARDDETLRFQPRPEDVWLC